MRNARTVHVCKIHSDDSWLWRGDKRIVFCPGTASGGLAGSMTPHVSFLSELII